MSSCLRTSPPAVNGAPAKGNNNKSNLKSAWGNGGGRLVGSNSTQLSEKEEDYDYNYLQLDSKPELVDRQRGGKKGRRHAGEALLQRKLQRQAYLIKDVLVEGDGKHVGKKRRARLLSDHLEDFNISVPYSLNRKNRWNALNDTAGCIAVANELSTGNAKSEPVKYSIVESYFRWNPSDGLPSNRPDQGVKSYQEFNMDGQLVTHRQANSARGSTLQNLMAPTQSDPTPKKPVADEETEWPALPAPAPAILGKHDLNVQYRVSKAHPVGKLMGIDFSKSNNGKSRGRFKRVNATSMTSSVYSNGPDEFNKFEVEEDEGAQDENDDYMSSFYRAKKNTYTLADFIKDEQEQPVIVRRNKSTESLDTNQVPLEEQYNFVLLSGVELAESVLKGSSSAAVHDSLSGPSFSSQLMSLKSSKAWMYECVNLPCDRYAISSVEEWQEQCELLRTQLPKLKARQLDPTRLMLDLSSILASENRQPTRPLLVVVVDQQQGKLVVNTAFKCSLEESRLEAVVRWKTFTCATKGLINLVNVVADVCRPYYEKSLEEEHCFSVELQKTMYNSQRLSVAVKPMDVYTILELNSAHFKGCSSPTGGEQQFVLLSPQVSNHSSSEEKEQALENIDNSKHEDDELSLSDFETIEMEDFDDGEKKEPAAATEVTPKSEPEVAERTAKPFLAACEQCGDKQQAFGVTINMLEGCGHRYCSKCLSQSLMSQMEVGKVPMMCLSPGCESDVPLELLQAFMPLPLANYCASIQFVTSAVVNGKLVSQCTACQELALVDKVEDFNQLACTRCGVHWCMDCGQKPHWPLKCNQAQEWAQKFELQCVLNRARATDEIGDDKSQPNVIAQQFSLICSQSRVRRLDTKTSWQLAKNMRRLTNYKMERQFVDLRKTALHLLEHGYAWLYMTRGGSSPIAQNGGDESCSAARPKQWSQIKALLSSLHKRIEGLDSELLFSSSLTDTEPLLAKISATEELVGKIVDKFIVEP